MNLNWWLIGATGAVGLVTFIILIRLVKKAHERDALKEVNRELHHSIDEIVAAEHRKEKIYADHEARLVEIAGRNNLDRARIVRLLESWPGEGPEAGAPDAAKH